MFRGFNLATIAFLAANLIIRFGSIFNYAPYNGYLSVFFAVILIGSIAVILHPDFLKFYLAVFGFSFFLFGFGSIDIHSRVFELLVTCVATVLFLVKRRNGGDVRLNKYMATFLWCYVLLSCFSLLLLPIRHIAKDLWFFGFPDAFFYLFIGPAYGFYYPVAMVIQLALFTVFAVQLGSVPDRARTWNYMLLGIFLGAVFCAFIGLLDFYRVINLAWFRFEQTVTPGVLHSTFQNRNCFAEYVLTVTPFVLIGFLGKKRGLFLRLSLFACLIILETALILAGGRAGWLAYPLILFFCWLFFYFVKDGRLTKVQLRFSNILKLIISIPLTIIISVILTFYVLLPISSTIENESPTGKKTSNYSVTIGQLKSQLEKTERLDSGGRDVTARQGLNVARESPVFGMGYETFQWHANILYNISESYFRRFYGNSPFIHDSPHNVFLSIFVSGGLAGLCLWLLILGYSLFVLQKDLIAENRLANIAIILSIISFHIYGMFQTMQYIPMIWLLIFLNLGYVAAIGHGSAPIRSDRSRLERFLDISRKASFILVLAGLVFYAMNFESRGLAKRYGLDVYSSDQTGDRLAGFFQPSKRWNYGDYRWSGKEGAIYVSGGGKVEIEFLCRTPGLEIEPVVVSVFNDGRMLDEIIFATPKPLRRSYSLPVTPDKDHALILKVSRTWNPHKELNNFDRRNLGIGIKLL